MMCREPESGWQPSLLLIQAACLLSRILTSSTGAITSLIIIRAYTGDGGQGCPSIESCLFSLRQCVQVWILSKYTKWSAYMFPMLPWWPHQPSLRQFSNDKQIKVREHGCPITLTSQSRVSWLLSQCMVLELYLWAVKSSVVRITSVLLWTMHADSKYWIKAWIFNIKVISALEMES